MSFEWKPGQGGLFKNGFKQNDDDADYAGEINIDGTTYKVKGWSREGKKGQWLKLSVKLPQQGTFRPKGYSREEAQADVQAKFGLGAYPGKKPGFPAGAPPGDFNDDLSDSSVPF